MSFKIPSSIPTQPWRKGLAALNQLWKRGLLPEDLDRHYFLHWFVEYGGNIIRTAKALQIHRNTIQGHFLALGYSKKSVRLRHAWTALDEKAQGLPFETKFHDFYRTFGKKPALSKQENEALVGLWRIKFPFKSLTPHYFLWAIRAGKPKEWVQKTSDYSYRHRARLLNPLLSRKTRDGFWLSPEKPRLEEIYSPRYRKVLSKGKG